MRHLLRAAGLAMLASLTAAVILIRPGTESVAAAAQPPAAEVNADLALVPADALGFVHVRAADLWKNDVFAGFRGVFEKAGPKALAALDAQFVPKVSTFDRITGFLMLDGDRKEPMPFAVLRFTAPFDRAALVKAYLPDAAEAKIGEKTVYASDDAAFELYFPDDRHIVIGAAGTVAGYLKHDAPKSGQLSYGLKLAAAGKPVVAALNIAALPIPPRELEGLPAEVKPLLKAEHITVSLDLGAAAKIDLVAGYKNAAEADDAEKAIKALADYGRKELAKIKAEVEEKLFDPKAKGPRPGSDFPEALFSVFALGAINHADELLANPGALVKRDGTMLTAGVALPKELIAAASGFYATALGLLLPAVQKVRMAAARTTSQNNLKQIAIAIHAYHDANGHMPHDIVDKDGKPILSWRVAILPYIEQDNVYRKFKLDEPWDSANNKQWSQLAIKTYLSPQANTPNPAGLTHYQGFVGPGTVFEAGKKLKFNDITDGTSNTIMVVETADAVPWAKPGGIPFDPKKPLPKLVPPGSGVVNVAMCDGSVRATKGVDEKTLKALITRSGGEVVDLDK